MATNIKGHARQMEELREALSAGRLPNAYLFFGPRGVGKRLVADAFSMQAMCLHPSEAGGCGRCPGCVKAKAGSHPDLILVEPEAQAAAKRAGTAIKGAKPSEQIKIDEVRELASRLQFHPLEAKRKIAIIDEADRMTEAAQNSLLKLIEEPPPATHLILISSSPLRLLTTIRSRCRQLPFSPLATDEVISELEKTGLSKKDARSIARLACGSIGRAREITPDLIRDVIEKISRFSVVANSADIISAAEGFAGLEPAEIRTSLEIMTSWYRDCLLYRLTGDPSMLIHPEASASFLSASRADRSLSEIIAARQVMESTANKQLLFEQLFFTLSA